SSSGPTKVPAAPPSSTAWSGRPSGTPPAISITLLRRVPYGTSYTPGRSMQPDRQNSRVPVDMPEPAVANAAPPNSTISGTLTSVSTLLTTVGLPNSPDETGNGGLLRGSPRYPSIELNSAVSSPQMYAPAPRRTSRSKPSSPAARV